MRQAKKGRKTCTDNVMSEPAPESRIPEVIMPWGESPLTVWVEEANAPPTKRVWVLYKAVATEMLVANAVQLYPFQYRDDLYVGWHILGYVLVGAIAHRPEAMLRVQVSFIADLQKVQGNACR